MSLCGKRERKRQKRGRDIGAMYCMLEFGVLMRACAQEVSLNTFRTASERLTSPKSGNYLKRRYKCFLTSVLVPNALDEIME